MTLNRLLTTLMQSFFGAIAITMWVMIIRDILHDYRIAKHEKRSQVSWVFPPHSETERLAAAQRLFDTDVDDVHSDVDGVQ